MKRAIIITFVFLLAFSVSSCSKKPSDVLLGLKTSMTDNDYEESKKYYTKESVKMLEDIERAYELDPMDLSISENLAYQYQLFGRPEDAMKVAKDDDFLRGVAHSELNLGVFYLEQFNVKKSISFFKKALENARVINDVMLQEQISQRLTLIERDLGTDASHDEIKEALGSLRGASSPQKGVLFVLDYSGSMSGSRSRASVRGSIDLFDTEIKDRDTMGIVIFNTDSRTILEPLAVKNNRSRIKQMLQRLTRPTGNTALWDAVAEAPTPAVRRGPG